MRLVAAHGARASGRGWRRFAVAGVLFINGREGAVFSTLCVARGSTGRSSRLGRSSTFFTGFGFGLGFGLGLGSGLWITTGASFGGSEPAQVLVLAPAQQPAAAVVQPAAAQDPQARPSSLKWAAKALAFQ